MGNNELLLIVSVLVVYSSVVIWYRFFGQSGLMAFSVFAVVIANVEVVLFLKAFGIEQTLGNVLFASTFLITDALSEVGGKPKKAIYAGLASSVLLVIFSQMWMHFDVINEDVKASFANIFALTPRIVVVSLGVYFISQLLDVYIYHRIWSFSTRLSGDKNRFLWLRNNVSTLISQFINAILFNFGAFYGVLELGTIYQFIISTYIIYIFTSLLDTPFLYLIAYIKRKNYK